MSPLSLVACSITGMQKLRPSTRDELIVVWLRSEWNGVRQPKPASRQLIDSPDLKDSAQNVTRIELLFRHRGPILQPLPYEMQPEWVNIEPADLSDLYIVPTFDWYLDTGRTFRLIDTAANLAAGRGFLGPQGQEPVDHLTKVNDLALRLANYDAATTDEVLILIAADWAGPFTIIDGTHRAAALYRNHLAAPNMPWSGLLVVDDAVAECVWHIESPSAQGNLNSCAWNASRGALW